MTEGPLRPFCPRWRQDPPGSLPGPVLCGMNWEGEKAVNPVPRMPEHLFPSLGGRSRVDPSSALSHGPSLQPARHRKKEPRYYLRGLGGGKLKLGGSQIWLGGREPYPEDCAHGHERGAAPCWSQLGKARQYTAQDRVSGRRNSIGSGQTFACGFQYHPTWNTILIKPGSYALGQVFSSKQRYLELFVSMFSPSPELTGIIQLELLPKSSSHLFCH